MNTEINKYFVEVRTDKNLGDSEFVESFLAAWLHHKNLKLRPEFFDLGEPVRRSFKSEGVDVAVRTWVEKQMPLMLRRGSAPKFSSSIKWRPVQGRDSKRFPWGCSTWLDFDAGDEAAGEFFLFIIKWFEPAFGMLTSWSDIREKHWIQRQTQLGLEQKFVGLDVDENIPGLYWQTYIGHKALKLYPDIRVAGLRTEQTEEIEDGYLLRIFKTSDLIGTERGKEAEKLAMSRAGGHLFFCNK